MNKILNVALNDLRITFKNRAIWLQLVLVPSVLILAVAFANGAFQSTVTEPPKVLLDVVNYDISDFSTRFLTTLRQLDNLLVLCPMDNTADDICQLGGASLDGELITTRLNNGVTKAYLEIPANFGDALINDQPVTLIDRSTESQNSATYTTIQTAAQRISAALVARRLGVSIADASFDSDAAFAQGVYDQAEQIWTTNPVSIAYSEAPVDTSSVASASQNPGFRQSVPGMGSMYVMFTVLAGVMVLLQERQQWTMQRLITMPVTGQQVIAGKMLSRFILGMIQYAVAFGVGLIFARILGFNFGNSPLALILVAASFAACICGLTLLLATIVKNEDQAGSMTTLVSLVLAPIGGAWWSLDFEFIPDFMRQISYISPFRWVMLGFNKVIYENGGIVDVLPYAAVLLVTAAVLGLIAARRFKYD